MSTSIHCTCTAPRKRYEEVVSKVEDGPFLTMNYFFSVFDSLTTKLLPIWSSRWHPQDHVDLFDVCISFKNCEFTQYVYRRAVLPSKSTCFIYHILLLVYFIVQLKENEDETKHTSLIKISYIISINVYAFGSFVHQQLAIDFSSFVSSHHHLDSLP